MGIFSSDVLKTDHLKNAEVNFKLTNFSSSVWCLHTVASLRTTPSTNSSSLENSFHVGFHPRPVLLCLPQHQQDLSDIQGESSLFFLPPSSSNFIQPIEFNQLDHEKRFKFVFKGLLIVITVYVASFCAMLNFLEPGAVTKKGRRGNFDVVFLAGEDGSVATMFNLLTFCVS